MTGLTAELSKQGGSAAVGVSWGGVESLVLSPNRGDNLASLDAQRLPHGLVRVSIGLEGADILIEDIAASLDALAS